MLVFDTLYTPLEQSLNVPAIFYCMQTALLHRTLPAYW